MKKLFVILCWIILIGVCPAVNEPIDDHTPQIRIDYKLWSLTVWGGYAEINFGATPRHNGSIDDGTFTATDLIIEVLPHLQPYGTKKVDGSVIYIQEKNTASVRILADGILADGKIHRGSLSAEALYPIWEKAFANVKPRDTKEFAMLLRSNDPFSGMRENLNSYITRVYPDNSEGSCLGDVYELAVQEYGKLF